MFKLILGLTALLIAGCAAFFSVKGIATLFSGAFVAAIIMAGSLELGKLVATTFLHHYWNKTAFLLKMYLLAAILLLMSITSMGTYGFLSAAYQSNATKYQNIDGKIELIEQQKNNLLQQSAQLQERISTLNETRKQQEKNLTTATTTKYKLVYSDVERSNKEIAETNTKIDELQRAINEKDNETSLLKLEITQASDIGAFKFIAENFNIPLNTVVKWFIIAIVIVFDPLAVALILAFNTLIGKRNNNTGVVISDTSNTSQDTSSLNEPATSKTFVNKDGTVNYPYIEQIKAEDLLGAVVNKEVASRDIASGVHRKSKGLN